MSHYTKARAANYYNGLLTGTDAEFKKLLKKYSICPPSDVAGYRGDDVGTIGTMGNATPGRNRLTNTIRGEAIRTAQVQGNKLVAYIELCLKARGTLANTGNEGGDVISFNATYTNPPPLNHDPIYFLPWDIDGASVRMTIPGVGVNNPDPNIFFTAAINGCSIFFQGTSQAPTIYHCGASTTGYAKAEFTETVEFWEEVIAEFMADDVTQGRPNLGALSGGSVNKTHYVASPGVKSKPDVTNIHTGTVMQSFTTKRAKSYQNALKAKHGMGKLTIEEISPWACVLGRRDAHGNWTFYLQENATVIYHQVTRSLPNLFQGQKSATQAVARPLKFKEIFPVGPGHVTVRAGLPRIV